MTYKIAVMGAACAGKSTLTAETYSKLKKDGFDTALALEFVRDGFVKGLEVKTASEQLLVYNKQFAREDTHDGVADVMITDSPLFLTYIYGLINYKNTPTDRMSLMDLYENFLKNINRYDLVIMLERKHHDYVIDGVRQQSKEEADQLHKDMKTLMDLHGIDYEQFDSYNEALDFIVIAVNSECPHAVCDNI